MRLRLMGLAILAGMFLLLSADTIRAEKKIDKKKDLAVKLPDNVELVRDVEYGTGGGRALKLHVLRPKTTPKEAMPVVVWIHGGGWENGTKDSGIGRLAPFASRAYFCASIEYRLSKEAVFPAQIEDCKCAIRFLRAKAKTYNLDPNRIGVWGSSAGGHLVALLGTSDHVKELEGKGGWADQSSRVNAVCDFCGPSDFIKIVGKSNGAKGPVGRLLGGGVDEKKDLARLAAPVTHVTKNAPPFLIVHGDKVPLEQANILHAALEKAGVRSTLHVAKGQGHGLGGPEVMQAVQDFFDRELKAVSK